MQTKLKSSKTLLTDKLDRICNIFPEYTIAQHLAGILRRKSPEVEASYYWSDEQLLEHVIEYEKEIVKMKLNNN